MIKKYIQLAIAAILLTTGAIFAENNTHDFIVLCYHDIPNRVESDRYAVSLKRLVDEIEYLRTHNYNFISPDDIRAARDGKKPLPDNAALLTFDDGYISFYENVVPVLELFNIPAVLAICSSWIEDGPPDNIVAPLMNWKQIQEMDKHPLVYLASHSHDLHHGERYNPQGNTSHAAISRIYFPDKKRYETEDEHRQRISDDMKKTVDAFQSNIGSRPKCYVWPYGQYNSMTINEAKKAGFDIIFTLHADKADTASTVAIKRWMIMENPKPKDFVSELKLLQHGRLLKHSFTRFIQVDLDSIYDDNPELLSENMDRLLDRLVAIRSSHVILQGFADPDGDGNVDAVYFPNSILPMKADILNRISNQLIVRGIQIYVWMPMLSIIPPNYEEIQHLYVKDQNGLLDPDVGYNRLSPFSDEARDIMVKLYSDLAAHVRMDGVVFQDDGILTDFEDYSAAGLGRFNREFGDDTAASFADLNPEQQDKWTDLKTATLIAFSKALKNAVLKHRPDALFARTLYAPVLEKPHSEEWFAQNYESSLEAYDKVIIMAYPEMEGVFFKERWLKKLVRLADEHEDGLEKTIFKIQTYDWSKEKWIADKDIVSRLRKLIAAGAKHVAYYPDDYKRNKPGLNKIKMEMSVQSALDLPPKTAEPVNDKY